ncbi:general transcription factor 3C polypeptide 3-like isoform X1 [Dreissena polymorpha]|nr:general transcription factor 3C polypeptide 3-like isoform X1 [Dreissena polymorpha]
MDTDDNCIIAGDESAHSDGRNAQSGHSNPFSNVGQDIDEEQLKKWTKENKRVRGLVQMSDEEDDESFMIDESLLVTDVTADTFSFDLPSTSGSEEVNTAKQPSTSQGSSTMLGLPVSTDLTLQYLSGKITFLEFSDAMERANTSVDNEIHIEIVSAEPPDGGNDDDGGEDDVAEGDDVADADAPKKSKKEIGVQPVKKRKKMARRCDLPKELLSHMGEVNIMFARGQHDEAIKECLEIIRMAPNANKPFQTLGMIYEDLGDTHKALYYFLIAAYLDSQNFEEWLRLAEMCMEQGDYEQAAKCYSQGARGKGDMKKRCIYQRCQLYERLGDKKKAIEGYLTLLPLLTSEAETEQYFKLAWSIARNFYDSGEKSRSIDIMATAFKEHPNVITSEDVNLFLDMQIPEKMYIESIAVIVKHCGVCVHFAGGSVWDSTHNIDIDTITDRTISSTKIPDILPIDLRVKLSICLIHLKYKEVSKPVIAPLFEEDVETNGDLFLDIAEAYMDNGYFKQALPILKTLVQSKNYNLAAVLLRYAECLKSLKDIHGSVQAYQCVVRLAPSHIGARMSLSALQQQLGKHDEALEALEHEDVEERTLTKEEQQMLRQKCFLLISQGKLDDLVVTLKQLLFQEWKTMEAENMTNLQAIRTYKHRKDTLIAHFNSKLKESGNWYRNVLKMQIAYKHLINFDDLWDLFVKVSDLLIKAGKLVEFDEITFLGMLCPVFHDFERPNPKFEWLILSSSILTRNSTKAYTFAKHIVIENLESTHAWNMFMQAVMVCNDNRHNRFLLRKIINEPNNVPLGLMNGHTSMSSGSYKHSLGEYGNVFKRTPTDPMVSLCLGLDFVHIASQRFSAKRQYLIAQGMAFLHNYMELRGPCQETYYNLGRALQQLNILYAAVHYYRKALEYPPAIGERGGMFDLTQEIAYNLALIYQTSGSVDYARYILWKYCVI